MTTPIPSRPAGTCPRALAGPVRVGAGLAAATALALPLAGLGSVLAPSAPAAAAPTGASTVVISEVESDNGEPGDWVELANTGADAVDVSGWAMKDDKDDRTWTIPAGTVIEPGAFLVLDEESSTNPTGFDFGLGKADQVRLYLADGTTLVDEVAWTQPAATTLSVCGDQVLTANPITRGEANDCTPPSDTEDPEAPEGPVEPVAAGVVINEVVSDGGIPDDWVELVNPTDAPVDISGWYVLDEDDTKDPSVIVDGTVLQPGEFFVIERDELGFGLGKGDQARLFLPDGTLVGRAAWPAGTHATPSLARCPDGTGDFQLSAAATQGTANNCAAALVISEVRSQGEDFVEIRNDGTEPVDAGGFAIKDNDDTHTYTIPAGTVIAPGAHLLVTGGQLGFGLGGADSARLFAPDRALISTVSWTEHVAPSLGLCEGEYVAQATATPGAANDCVQPDPAARLPTTGDARVTDQAGEWAEDLSGLDLQILEDGQQILWASNNDAGQVSRLVRAEDGTWVQSEGWPTGGKPSRFPDGTGTPDAEGISAGADGAVYISVELYNDAGGTNRNAVLRLDPVAAGDELVAKTEWDLTALLPATGANAGLEAIEVVPVSAMTHLGEVPAGAEAYTFVALEATGDVYAVALLPDGQAHLVATMETPLVGVMALDYDPGLNRLWAFCDEVCDGESVQFELSAATVEASARIARAEGLPNVANEGVAVAPAGTCTDGALEAWFADDADTDGHSLRGVLLAGLECELPAPPADGDDDADDGADGDSGQSGGQPGEQPGADEGEQPGAGDGTDSTDDHDDSAGSDGPADRNGAGDRSTTTDRSASTDRAGTARPGLARTGTDALPVAMAALALLASGGVLLRRTKVGPQG
ncbi:lamin tail domain-containing protein [Brachybacterium muris]|uniref:lamin tail domain-containing protein n=1 Tax=Brachybacterium muris TaxID=219301 RepID=UPI0021A2FB17|nr:lamin tail domain-containing protein [Brachybacterium muris]MCT1999147.1 lamin tail domain-containing protein [Brachybacterium muris]